MNRINNKNKRNATGEWAKHPRPYLKRLGNKKLRKLASSDIINFEEAGRPRRRKKRNYRKYRSPSKCPFCLSNIPAQYKDCETKKLGLCKKCDARKAGNVFCTCCKSNNVWLSKTTYICKNCGEKWSLQKA